MNVRDIKQKLGLERAAGEKGMEREITGVYCGDLLSDVMANSKNGDIWLTIQSHKNVLAVAVLKEISAIILVNGHKPDEDTINKANEEAIPILLSSSSAFKIACALYEAGITS